MLTAQAMGNLGRDPEEKSYGNGKRLASFSIATNKKIKGEKITTWVNVSCFDEFKVDFIMNYLKKGMKVFVEGEPSARHFTTKAGEAASSLDITMSFGSKIEICSDGNASEDSGPLAKAVVKATRSPADDLDDEIPGWD